MDGFFESDTYLVGGVVEEIAESDLLSVGETKLLMEYWYIQLKSVSRLRKPFLGSRSILQSCTTISC
jgi:hypothetical protein